MLGGIKVVDGNKKGGGFERKTLKALSLWISKGERKDIFRRSIMSGGRATIALASGSKEYFAAK